MKRVHLEEGNGGVHYPQVIPVWVSVKKVYLIEETLDWVTCIKKVAFL